MFVVVVVCGEALIDMIHTSDGTERVAPGGGPFNTARGLARLGVPTAFLGRLSTDEHGQELAGLLKEDGVGVQYATFGPERTTIAVADVDREGRAEYRFLVDGTSVPNLTAGMVPSSFGSDVKAIHLGSLGLALEPVAKTLETLANREHGKRMLVLDPNVRAGLAPESEYRDRLHRVIAESSVVKASKADLAWLYPGLEYSRAAERMLDEGVSVVVVTLGADGAFGAHADARVRVPAPHVRVVDTIGAGDAFGAALLAWLLDHDRIGPRLRLDESELRDALEYACLAAAITCTRTGADPPRKSEMVPT